LRFFIHALAPPNGALYSVSTINGSAHAASPNVVPAVVATITAAVTPAAVIPPAMYKA